MAGDRKEPDGMSGSGEQGSVRRPGHGVRAALWLYRAALGAYPVSFRERHGGAMESAFLEGLQARGPGAAGIVHVAREVAGLLVHGMRARLGGGRRFAEQQRPKAGAMSMLMQDIRYGLRTIFRNPGFAIVAVIVLGLGIGANTAIFSAVNAVLLQPLPVRDEKSLVMLWEKNPEKGWYKEVAAPANMLDWKEGVESFADVAAYSGEGPVTLTGQGEAVLLNGVNVTGNFFDVIGERAGLGRTLVDEETWSNAERVVVLSDAAWRDRFGGDRSVVGTMITLQGLRWEVVGVMPPGFSFPSRSIDIWIPERWDPAYRSQTFFRRAHWIRPIARLKRGATLEQADAQLQAVVDRLSKEYPETNRVMGAGLTPLHEFLVGDRRASLLILFGSVGLLLLLACANVGNLMLVRATGRRREMAVRAALGAGRARLARQMLTESVLLSLCGGALGMGIGVAGLSLLSRVRPEALADTDWMRFDWTVLGYTTAITIGAGLLFGLLPALRTGTDVGETLKDGSRTGTAGRRSLRASNLLVIGEVVLALLLVTGAGLLVRSYMALRQVDPGFRFENGTVLRMNLPGAAYPKAADLFAFYDQLEERLQSLPGVETITMTDALPLTGTGYTTDYIAEGRPPGAYGTEVAHRRARPGYFEAMHVPILRGRPLTEPDREDTEPVVVINKVLADSYFPNEDPIGKRIAFDKEPTAQTQWWRIVGVSGNELQRGIGQPPQAEVYVTPRQEPTSGMNIIVFTRGVVPGLVQGMRNAVAAIDVNLPSSRIQRFEDIYRESLARDRFMLLLLATFAAVALTLAAVGIYGVGSQAARRRTQEIGIRVALGARAGQVMALVVRQAVVLALAGIAAGEILAFAFARVMSSVLFGIEPRDAVTFVVVPGVLALAAVIATWLPARRAVRIDPVTALRIE
jgi:putative ABC transport system permease protein